MVSSCNINVELITSFPYPWDNNLIIEYGMKYNLISTTIKYNYI